MKLTFPKILLAIIAMMVFAFSAPVASASTPHKMTAAQMTAMCKTMSPEDCTMMMREMLKNPKLHKSIMDETKASSEYQKYYQQHIGSGG